MKKPAMLIVLCVLMLTTAAGLRANAGGDFVKEEAVYALLERNGTVHSIYVVNSFETVSAREIVDYGDYSEVRNLTTTGEIGYSGGRAVFETPGGRFYYQGNTVSKQLPWNISIRETLDGVPAGEKDAGRSGAWEMTVEVSENPEFGKEYFEHYMLQISLALDAEKHTDISADGATVANSGSTKSIAFTHLPGSEKSYTIKAETSGYEPVSLQFGGVVFAMEIDMSAGEVTEDFTVLRDAVSALSDGGAELRSGTESFRRGLEAYAGRSGALKEASAQFDAALSELVLGMTQLQGGSAQLQGLAGTLLAHEDPRVRALAEGCLAQAGALEQFGTGLQALGDGYEGLHEGISQLVSGADVLAKGYGGISEGVFGLVSGLEELRRNTASLDTDVQSRIDGIARRFSADDFRPASFTSEKNTVSSVQFVFRTRVQEPVKKDAMENEEKPLTFFERLLAIFGVER